MKKLFTLQFWKAGGSLTALATLLVILIALNVLAGRLSLRADLTQDRLYTLSQGTRAMLGKLDREVTLKFYFNGGAAEMPAPIKSFARQVEDLLKEYASAAHGRVILETYDPAPDSDAEEWAQRYGVAGQSAGLSGAAIYLGLVAVCGEQQAVLPVIDPRNEELLEYNITRLIYRVAHPRRPVVGVLSPLPVLGTEPMPYMMPGQPQPPQLKPWVVFSELRQDFELRNVSPAATEIEPDIDELVVVHPKNLTDATLYAIDQFVLRGGRLLAFVDPLCIADLENSGGMRGMQMPSGSSDLNRLFGAWGVIYDSSKVVADLEAATPVRGRDNVPEQSPLYLSLDKRNLNANDIATATLESLLMPFAGAFSGQGKDGVKVTPLTSTSEKSQLTNAMMAQFGGNAIRRDFKSGLQKLNLAVRLTGTFATAFPEGKPGADGGETNAAPAAAGLVKSAKPTTVLLVGDVDLLTDGFCVRTLNFFGNEAHQPINDNVAFVANAVEQLAGSTDLIAIRSRGKTDRPFTRVLALAREAQERWMLQERDLEEKMQAAQQRLSDLQAQKDEKQRYILTPEQAQEIARFKQELIENRRELKAVRKNLREGIETLGLQVKVINILLLPVAVAALGMILAWRRRGRTAGEVRAPQGDEKPDKAR